MVWNSVHLVPASGFQNQDQSNLASVHPAGVGSSLLYQWEAPYYQVPSLPSRGTLVHGLSRRIAGCRPLGEEIRLQINCKNLRTRRPVTDHLLAVVFAAALSAACYRTKLAPLQTTVPVSQLGTLTRDERVWCFVRMKPPASS